MSESLTVGGWRLDGDVATVPDRDLVLEGHSLVEALPRRRSYSRGALVRRMLLVADISGLIVSFVVANLILPSFSESGDKVGPQYEYAVFLLALPLWILLLRLEGLYDRDEERTDHSTVDDIVGVFRAVTIGVWLFALFGVATNAVHPLLGRLGLFWVIAVLLVPTLRAGARVPVGTCPAIRRTPSSSGPARSDSISP